MGCSSSKEVKNQIVAKTNSIFEEIQIPKRNGHPNQFRLDGYDLGLRVRIHSNKYSVFIGTSRATGEKVTIKEFHLANYNENFANDEIQLLTKLIHPCLPKLREVFTTSTSIFLVTEYVDPQRLKNLVDIKNKKSAFTQKEVQFILAQILSLIEYCHSKNVILRNINLNSIMVKKIGVFPDGTPNYQVKLADLSYAVLNGSIQVISDHPLFEWEDVYFLPPEALLGHPFNFSLDIWSFGVLIFALTSAELPFIDQNDDKLVELIKNSSYSFRKNESWDDFTNETVKLLIKNCLIPLVTQRYTAKELIKHPYFQLQA